MQPDFNELLKVLRREPTRRPVLFEFFMNGPLYDRLSTRELNPNDPLSNQKIVIDAFRQAGYDYATMGVFFGFPTKPRDHAQSLSLNAGFVITDRESFDAYEWPVPENHDYSVLDALAPELPDGMKLICQGPGGVLENVIGIVGFDNLCMMTFDDPDLTQEIFDHVGSRLVKHYECLSQFDAVGAMISNDDWGFKSQPMLTPTQMRTYVIPWHREIVKIIHDAGRPAILHSCGNQELLMDDIIDDIGFDGKHSYEDVIQPVEDAYEQYHERIAILGGIDVDFLCRSTPEEITNRCRAMLERTMDRGGFALGSGNSIPNYVPQENYLAMIHSATENRR